MRALRGKGPVTVWAAALCTAVGCSATAPSNFFHCTFDRDCPDGQLCGNSGVCDQASLVRMQTGATLVAGTFAASSGAAAASAGVAAPLIPVPAGQPSGGAGGAGIAAGGRGGTTAGTASAGRPAAPAAVGGGGSTPAAGSGSARPSDGTLCADASSCESGHCVDGHCCQLATCNGVCQRCGNQGRCEPVTDGPDPDSCKGMAVCDAQARCILPDGAECKDNAACNSGSCVDGVCCEHVCGTCQACNVAGHLGRCQLQGGDDDLCGSGRSCTLGGECLSVGEATSTTEGGLIYNFGNYRGGKERTGQIVTPRAGGTLAEVRLGAYCRSGEPLTASIQSVTGGQPSGTELARLGAVESMETAVQHPDHLNAFTMSVPLQLTAGVPIAIVLSAPTATQECDVRGSGSEIYAGGQRLWTSTQNMPQSGEFYLEDGDLFFKFLMSR